MARKKIEIALELNQKEFKKELADTRKELNATKANVNSLEKNLKLQFDGKKAEQGVRDVTHAIELADKQSELLRARLKQLEKEGKIDTVEYQNLSKQLNNSEVNAYKLEQQLKRLERLKIDSVGESFQKLGNSIESSSKKIDQLGQKLAPISALTGAGVYGIKKLTADTIKYSDDIATLSERLNISAESLQKWQYIAMQTDVETTEMRTGFRNLNAEISKLASGQISKGTQALQALGISQNDALGGLDKNLDNIINKLIEIENPAERLAVANELFGARVGQSLIPLLNQGTAGLETLKDEFNSLGYVTNEQVAKLAEFDNVLNKLKLSFKLLKNQLGQALLPIVENFAKLMSQKLIPVAKELVNKFDSLSDETKSIIGAVLAITTALAPAFFMFGKLGAGVAELIKLLGTLKIAISGAGLALGGTIAPIIAVLGLFGLLMAKSEELRESFAKIFEAVKNVVTPIIETVGNLLTVVFGALGEMLANVGQLLAPIIDKITKAFEIIANILGQRIVVQIKAVTAVISALFQVLKPVIDFINKVVLKVLDKVASVVVVVAEFISSVINGFLKLLERAVNGILRI